MHQVLVRLCLVSFSVLYTRMALLKRMRRPPYYIKNYEMLVFLHYCSK
jgi:hypothetical protein